MTTGCRASGGSVGGGGEGVGSGKQTRRCCIILSSSDMCVAVEPSQWDALKRVDTVTEAIMRG